MRANLCGSTTRKTRVSVRCLFWCAADFLTKQGRKNLFFPEWNQRKKNNTIIGVFSLRKNKQKNSDCCCLFGIAGTDPGCARTRARSFPETARFDVSSRLGRNDCYIAKSLAGLFCRSMTTSPREKKLANNLGKVETRQHPDSIWFQKELNLLSDYIYGGGKNGRCEDVYIHGIHPRQKSRSRIICRYCFMLPRLQVHDVDSILLSPKGLPPFPCPYATTFQYI